MKQRTQDNNSVIMTQQQTLYSHTLSLSNLTHRGVPDLQHDHEGGGGSIRSILELDHALRGARLGPELGHADLLAADDEVALGAHLEQLDDQQVIVLCGVDEWWWNNKGG